jgi:hypothetical protein
MGGRKDVEGFAFLFARMTLFAEAHLIFTQK